MWRGKEKKRWFGMMVAIVVCLAGVRVVYADWPQQAKLLASDGAASDLFGNSVSISGDYAIVGAHYDDDMGTNSGSAYIFKRDGTSWSEQAKLLAADGAAEDSFGYSVSISGDYAVVGARWDDDSGNFSGSAYIFKRDGTNWSEQAKLLAADGAANDRFGYSVSISGDYAIVGAPYDDSAGNDAGSAYIFAPNEVDPNNWDQVAKLLAADGAAFDTFGYSVSISGDYAVIGAYGDEDNGYSSGSAYIFKRDGTNWSEQAKLLASDGAAGDEFGISVSVSGDYAIVGARGDDDNGGSSGSAYIFTPNDVDPNNWDQVAKLLAADGAGGDKFGYSVSISGDYPIVGAPYDDDNGSDSGSAYYSGTCIRGTKWHDTDGDFLEDTDEEPMQGWRIYIDVNENGQFDAGEPNDVTDGSGSYVLKVPAGTWVVAEQNRPYWEQTYPGGEGTYSVTLVENWQVAEGRDFGNARPTEIHGTKWHDIDGDGRLVEDTDEGEGAMQGWRIYVDLNENGQFDAAEPNDLTDANGNYLLTAPAAGTWLIAEEAKPCWEQTYPGGEETYSVTLDKWEVVEGLNFGNARPTEIHPSVWQQDEQDKLTASDGAAEDRFGISVSITSATAGAGSGDYAIFGAIFDDDNGSDSGSAYIFTPNDVNCGDWNQLAKLTAADGAASDRFGYSVSVSGYYAIVGAYLDDDNGNDSGSAYIFTPNDADPNNWDQVAKLVAADGAAFDYFGYSVSISGDYAIVGAYRDDANGSLSGSAYIFKRDGTNWSQETKLTAADGAADDRFGLSVSISGDYAIVGASLDDDSGTNSGSAYIFYYDGASWSQQAKLTAADGAANDCFGFSVSISGDYAIVGAYADDDTGSSSGSAYIFRRYGTSWFEQAKLLAADGAASDFFGESVSISGAYAIVGAWRDDDSGVDSGSAYIFKRSGTNWSEQAKLLASDGAAIDFFGISVSISGDYAIVGALLDDDNGTNSGSAYMFGKVLCPSADLTGDCFVNFYDLGRLAAEWLQGVE